MKKSLVLLGLASLLACTAGPASAFWWNNDGGFINRSRSSTTTTTTIVVRPYNAFSDMSANAICQSNGSSTIPLSLLGLGVGGCCPTPHVMPNTCVPPSYGYGYPPPYVPYPYYGGYPAGYYPPTAWYPPPPPPQGPPQQQPPYPPPGPGPYPPH